jgi:branched-chain amino acid transport system ATP-binding protein
MSAELARPLVPTGREESLGRGAETPDFSDHRVVEAVDPFAEMRPTTRLGRLRTYFSNLDPRKVDGPMIPLLSVALLSAIGAFARDGAQIALPDQQADLGIDLSTAIAITGVLGIPFGIARIWMGFLADRVNRVWMLRASGLIRALSFGLIGGATGLPTYAGGNVMGTAADVVGEPAGFTLIGDYYSISERIRVVFIIFQISSIAGILAFPVVGVLGGHFGWRVIFISAAIATLLVVLMQFFMKEVPRGYWERKALGADDEVARHEQQPLSFGEGFRTAWSIRYIRVMCLVAPVTGIIAFISLPLSQTYLASRFGLGITERGYLSMIPATCGTLGLLVLAPKITAVIGDRPRVVIAIQAAQGLITALFYVLLVQFDSVPYAVAVLSVLTLVGSTTFPLTFGLQLNVLPPRMRGQGLQVATLFAVLSPTLAGLLLGQISGNGYGKLCAIIAILSTLAAIIILSAAPHIERDLANGAISAMADEELRQYRASGHQATLLCRKVDVAYGGVQVLFGVDLQVARGEVVALLGTNGAGKSTLLRAIAGVQEPIGGAIFLDGVDVTHKPPHESAAAGVVVVPGGRAVCHSLTVRENLKLAAWLKRKDDDYVAERTAAALELFPRLAERLDTEAGNLSGGEQQMLAIAQSYLMEPRLLMIDELSLGLAPQVVESLLESIRAINATGTTILLVEQSINVALTIAERAIFMDKGEIRFDGSTEELLSRPDLVRSVFMGGAVTAGRTRRRVVTGVAGGEQLLRVNELTVSFGPVRALTDVSFEVSPREIVGIIGPNGAGKTTLFDAISGLVPTTSGTVELKGVDVSKMTLDARAAVGLGRSFQNARLFPSMTVRENIAVAMQKRIKSRNPLLAAVWAPPLRAAERKVTERVDDIIELLGLKAYADKFVGELSTGSRRAVDVGCIMVSGPDLLLLDEPSSGLAQAESEALGPLIQRIVRETGCGVIVIEHDLPLISSVSDRLIAMELGQVIATGTPHEVIADPEVQRAYLSASRDVLLRSDSAFGAALAAAGLTPDADLEPTS